MFKIDAFVVPNQATTFGRLKEWGKQVWLKKLAELNEIEMDDDDRMVEIWMVSEDDLKSTNLRDHGFKINGKHAHIGSCYLPAKIFYGKVEGDSIRLTFPVYVGAPYLDGETEETEMTADVTLNQKAYRYRRFGNFEDAMVYANA